MKVRIKVPSFGVNQRPSRIKRCVEEFDDSDSIGVPIWIRIVAVIIGIAWAVLRFS